MSKRIKSYTDFLKFRMNESEEVKVSVYDKIWKYEAEDFMDYVNDFKDAEWIVDFDKMVYREEYINVGSWRAEKYEYKDYLTDVLSSGEQTPAYVLTISKGDDGQYVDLTDSLKFLKGIVEDELNLECKFFGDNSDTWYDILDLENITIENGSMYNGEEKLEFLNIAFLDKDVNVTVLDLCEYYEWDYQLAEGDNPESNKVKIVDGLFYVRKDQDDLTFVAADVNGSIEHLTTAIDDYHNWEGNIDTDSLIRYHLNDDALKHLIKKIIADNGGLESFLNEYSDESDLDLEGKSEEEVIELILNERFKSTLEVICKDNDTVDYIRRDYDTWEAQSRVDKFEDNLQKDFDKILSNSFTFEKDQYRSEFKGGDGKWYNLFRYWILIEGKFIDGLFLDGYDLEDFKNCGLTALPAEWFEKCGESEKLYGNDPIYGDVDTDDFSNEMIAVYLKD